MAVSMVGAHAEQMVFAGCAVLCAAMASVYDVRERRIPNRLTGGALTSGLLSHYWLGGWGSLCAAMVAALVAGGLFLVFFIAGGMGAGDVKLIAAVGCVTGFESLQVVILVTVIAGGIFAVIIAMYHGRMKETIGNLIELLAHHGRNGVTPHPALNLESQSTLRLPFALPIAAGCIGWFCVLAFGHTA